MLGQFAMVYLDDTVVCSCTLGQYRDLLNRIFDALEENGLKLEPSDCKFNTTSVDLLGYVAPAHGITCYLKKTDVIV